LATDRLVCQFKVGQVSTTRFTDVRENIRKRREFVFYRTASGPQNVNLAYAFSKPITPQTNLAIYDRSASLQYNNPIRPIESIINAKTFTVKTDQILVTDIFTQETPTRVATPLYFKHDLSDILVSGNNSIIDISLVNKDQVTRSDLDSLLVLNSGIVYSNHQNNIDNSGTADVTFVKFSVRDLITNSVLTRLEILDQEPIFRPATFADIDPDLGILDSTSNAYLVEDLSGYFEIQLPRPGKFGYRIDNTNRLTIIPPSAIDLSNPWFISIGNGRFFAVNRINPTSAPSYKYEVAEFDTQLFTPAPPFKLSKEEKSTIITTNLIKTIKTNIILDPLNDKNIKVIVKNSEEITKYAYTTDPNILGQKYEGSVKYTNGIRSVDRRNGFIDITDPMDLDDIVLSTYYFEETRYEVIQTDFNPSNNRDILNYKSVFYVVPNESDSRLATIYHLKTNSLGKVLSTSQEDNGLLTAVIASGINYDVSNVDFNSPIYTSNGLSFLDRFSTESKLNPYISSHATLLAQNSWFFVLGEVNVFENTVPKGVDILDIRQGGGGLINDPELRKEALEIQPESRWFWDIGAWDGLPFPSTANYYIEVPCELLTDFGGRFKPDEVREVVLRHTALGVYPIIKTYTHEAPITITSVTTTSITFIWPRVTDSTSKESMYWNIRVSNSEDGLYSHHNIEPHPDGGTGSTNISYLGSSLSNINTFTLTGLATNTEYWIYIIEVDKATGKECGAGAIGPEEDDSKFKILPLKTGVKTLPLL
jgi:hypothetical protein